jgi:nitrate/nitrite-specific signal transduction histidine kinase
LLAVTREALRNIRKHAKAQSIQIELQRSMSEIAVMIQDDGAGFTGDEKPGHFGLAQMRDTAARAGAAVQVASTRSGGTRVLLHAREHGSPAPRAGMMVKDAADE